MEGGYLACRYLLTPTRHRGFIFLDFLEFFWWAFLSWLSRCDYVDNSLAVSEHCPGWRCVWFYECNGHQWQLYTRGITIGSFRQDIRDISIWKRKGPGVEVEEARFLLFFLPFLFLFISKLLCLLFFRLKLTGRLKRIGKREIYDSIN